MKKQTLILAIVLVIFTATFFTSCGSKSGKRVPKTTSGHHLSEASDPIILGVPAQEADSLKKIIAGLVSANYDSMVTSLKKLPEYQHAVFLTQKETREYMDIFRRLQNKFLAEKVYLEDDDNQFFKMNDTTYISNYRRQQCKIVFDTTQSITPIAHFSADFVQTTKKSLKAQESEWSYDGSDYECKVYFLSKFKLCYAILTTKDRGEVSYMKDMYIFDKEIRTLK